LSTIAPLNSSGLPDLYNYQAHMFVSLGEAKAWGLTHFYTGSPCRYGHAAARFVSNESQCTDCHRLTRGKQPVYGKISTPEWKPETYTKRKISANISAIPVAPQALEPDRGEKRFLENYASSRDFNKGAELAGMTTGQINARISCSAVFRAAVNDLESRLGLRQTYGPIEWNDDVYGQYIQAWINTGDKASARDAIRCTAFDFHQELERSTEFRMRVEAAEPLAQQVLEEKAQQLGLSGNDKMVQFVLKAEKPNKYGDKIKMDLNGEVRLTNDQLIAELARGYATSKRRIIEGELVDAEPRRAIAAPSSDEREAEAGESEPNSDLL
jgi:hypothetical protein